MMSPRMSLTHLDVSWMSLFQEQMDELYSKYSPRHGQVHYTVINRCILSGRVQQTLFLLSSCQVNVNAQDHLGRTLLMLCSLVEDEKFGLHVAKLLLNKYKQNVKIDLCDKKGKTAVSYACQSGREALFQELVQRTEFEAFTLGDVNGNTPLHLAAKKGSLTIVKSLLESYGICKGELGQVNSLGYTAFLLTLKEGHFRVASLLLLEQMKTHNITSITEHRDSEYFLNARQWYAQALNNKRKTVISKCENSVRGRSERSKTARQRNPTTSTGAPNPAKSTINRSLGKELGDVHEITCIDMDFDPEKCRNEEIYSFLHYFLLNPSSVDMRRKLLSKSENKNLFCKEQTSAQSHRLLRRRPSTAHLLPYRLQSQRSSFETMQLLLNTYSMQATTLQAASTSSRSISPVSTVSQISESLWQLHDQNLVE